MECSCTIRELFSSLAELDNCGTAWTENEVHNMCALGIHDYGGDSQFRIELYESESEACILVGCPQSDRPISAYPIFSPHLSSKLVASSLLCIVCYLPCNSMLLHCVLLTMQFNVTALVYVSLLHQQVVSAI